MPNSLATIGTGVGILTNTPVRKPAVMTLALAVALATGIFTVPSAKAKPEMAGQNAEARFSAMDKDNDGKVTREEFFAAQPNMKEGAFVAIDGDADGALTIKEWKNFSEGHGKDSGKGSGMTLNDEGAPGAGPGVSGAGDSSGRAAPALIMPPSPK